MSKAPIARVAPGWEGSSSGAVDRHHSRVNDRPRPRGGSRSLVAGFCSRWRSLAKGPRPEPMAKPVVNPIPTRTERSLSSPVGGGVRLGISGIGVAPWDHLRDLDEQLGGQSMT